MLWTLRLLLLLGCPLLVLSASTAKANEAKLEVSAKNNKALPILRIAMQDFTLEGVDPRTGLLVQSALLAELRKLRGVSVISLEEVRAMLELETEKNKLGCNSDTCLTEIASALGADVVLVGTLARIGDEHLFGHKRVSQEEAKVIGQVNQRLVAQDGEEFLAAIGPAVEKLFPQRLLRKGQIRGVADEVALKLNPPPFSPWVFWTLAGSTAALSSIAISAMFSSVLSAVQYAKLIARAQKETLRWQELDSARTQSQIAAGVALGFAGSALVAATATGVIALFVDWQGYGEVKE